MNAINLYINFLTILQDIRNQLFIIEKKYTEEVDFYFNFCNFAIPFNFIIQDHPKADFLNFETNSITKHKRSGTGLG